MLTKRIIPCLDVKDGKTVKGVNFENLRDAGDPVELGRLYADQGADELVFLDISATLEKRKTLVDLVRQVAREINIQFTVGGGISSVEDVSALFPQAPEMAPGMNLFALLAADGTPIMITDTREAAIANAWDNELEMVSVH